MAAASKELDQPTLPKTGLPPRDQVAANLLILTLVFLLVVTTSLAFIGVFKNPSGVGDLHATAEATLAKCLVNGCVSNQAEVAQRLLDDTTVIDQYHEWWERVFERVASVLVPLVTALFGYIFGTQHKQSEE